MAEEIINYIKENLAKGVPQDQIRQSLLAKGWKQTDIDVAFLQLEAPPSSLPPFPIKPQLAQNQPPKSAGQKSFLNPKILIAVIFLLIVGGISYFLIIKKGSFPGSSKVTQTIENLTGIGELKECGDIKTPSVEEQETSLSAKFVLRTTDETSKKETFKLLDFNTKRESILTAQSPFTDDHFSPDGKYLIYKQRFEGKNNIDIIKFFLFDTAAETTVEIVPSFTIGYIDPHRIMWSQDSKQFIIWQQDDKTGKLENSNGSYFNVDDLKPNDLKSLLVTFSGQNAALYQFPKQNELVFRAFKQDGENVKYEFTKADLTNGSISPYKSFSIKGPQRSVGVFTPDFKYYVFTEIENYIPDLYKKSQEGKSEKELEEAYKQDFSKKLEAYIGYVDLDENCIKRKEITEIPIFYDSTVEIKQISEDSKKFLLVINSIDRSNNAEIRQYWRVDIVSLTKLTQGIKTIVDGEQINHISKMSPLFNYAIVGTVKEKFYLMNLKTGEATLLPAEPGKTAIMTSWLAESTQ